MKKILLTLNYHQKKGTMPQLKLFLLLVLCSSNRKENKNEQKKNINQMSGLLKKLEILIFCVFCLFSPSHWESNPGP